MLPTTQEYKISLMIGQDSFRTLEGVEVISNPNYPDEPWYSTGGLAIVFKLKLKDKLYALKCFYTEANERQERLGLIAAYLKQNPSPYFVDFTYLENELWVETANDEGQGYPVVLMEWVEGKTLDNYLEQICTQNNTPALKNLYFQFCNLAWWLQQQPIAHGDIKHDNLIVTPDGKLRLIDYDGVFVPSLRGRKANEMGSPCYQHPKRDAYFFDKNLDDFSLLVLQITLLALQHQPKLFTEHYNGDGIILKDTDYQNFAQSPIKTILWQLPEVKIPLLLSQLQGNLNNLSAIDLMPLLQDVAWINWLIGGQKDSKLEFERQRLKELVWGNKQWRYLFVEQIERNYSLNEKLIEKYKDKWNWNELSNRNPLLWSFELIEKFEDKWRWYWISKNTFLPWSLELIEKFKDKWNWELLSMNESLPWSVELLEKYEEKWHFNYLSTSQFLPWSMELIEKYSNRWCWGVTGWISEYTLDVTEGMSSNNHLPWSIELIEKYEGHWDWRLLSGNESLPWSIELIEKYKEWNWDWNWLSMNKSLPWSKDLIEKFEYKWNFYCLSITNINNSLSLSLELIGKYRSQWDWVELSQNELSSWSLEILEKYEHDWNWGSLSKNESLPWSISLIEKYESKWNWRLLSKNQSLPWTIELIKKYEKKWDWWCLSQNQSLPWSIELIEKYEHNWKKIFGNAQLQWSIELIEKYEGKWDWENLSKNPLLLWSIELIEKYEDKWDWENLSENPKLPWTIDLVDKYNDNWNWRELYEKKSLYEKLLHPLLSDEFIDEVMAEISGTS